MGKKGRKGFVIKPKQYNPTGMFYIVNDKKDTQLIMEFASKKSWEKRERRIEKSALVVNGIIFTVQLMDYLPKQSKKKNTKRSKTQHDTLWRV